MEQWLNACVAIERAVTAIKETRFVKRRSEQTAKFVIVILLMVIIGICVHDPIYRRLIDEKSDHDDLKRIWCIVSYPAGLEVYNYIMHIFCFFGPFLINMISAVILIVKQSRQKSNVRTHRFDKEHIWEQCREHRRLLIAPIALVILAVPRLIISFISKCMQSANDSWLFLLGYFISFIPPMLTFVVFVVPSTFYKQEFNKSVQKFRKIVQRCLHST